MSPKLEAQEARFKKAQSKLEHQHHGFVREKLGLDEAKRKFLQALSKLELDMEKAAASTSRVTH